jgi:hypothetical protein
MARFLAGPTQPPAARRIQESTKARFSTQKELEGDETTLSTSCTSLISMTRDVYQGYQQVATERTRVN